MTNYPFGAMLRHRDGMVQLECGVVEAIDAEVAFEIALGVVREIRDADPNLKGVEIVKIGDPFPVNGPLGDEG